MTININGANISGKVFFQQNITTFVDTNPSIIQFALNGDNFFSFPQAPTEGNLMVAMVQGSPNTGINGWTLAQSGTSSIYNWGLYYKYAGASESATQTYDTGDINQICAWEIHNAASNWDSAFDAVGYNSGYGSGGGSSWTIEPSQANEIFLYFNWTSSHLGGIAAQSGFTTDYLPSSNPDLYMAHQENPAIGVNIATGSGYGEGCLWSVMGCLLK